MAKTNKIWKTEELIAAYQEAKCLWKVLSPSVVSSIVNEVIGTVYFLFFMKRLINANKTLKNTYTLKTQGYLYILCLLMLFLKIYAQT